MPTDSAPRNIGSCQLLTNVSSRSYLWHMSEIELIGSAEAAALLGDKSVRQFTRRIERGQIVPVMKLAGKRGAYLFDRAAISALTPIPPVGVSSTPQ